MAGVFDRFLMAATALPLLAAGMCGPVAAEPVQRSGQAAGAVIARKSGEEVRFIDVTDWRFVDLKQDLLTGDILRTNDVGQLAIVFSDRTQVRLGRNSTLVVKHITASASADTVFQLQSGTIWARAERGGPGVKVETPAATAAIRGTDWTMTVKGVQTSLTVLEGAVELSNPQGSVDVRQGEGAVASIGQAPRKVVIVNSDDREQMLFYMQPRNAFNFMPASPLPVADMRRQADRIASIPPASRSTEDLLTLAEAQMSLEGRAAAEATLALVRTRSASSSQRARAALIEAVLAARDKRYADAARIFKSAEQGLDAKRRAIAVYGGYYARSLADPNHVERPPTGAGGAYGALLEAYAAGFLKDIPAAIEIIRSAERRYPADAALPAYRAQLAILLNDRAQAQEAIARSLALDPQEPTALEGRANFRAGFTSDLDGALADIQAALAVAPGSTTIWNALGNIHAERGDDRAAEAAFRKSIDLDPADPISYANLAALYLNQNRVDEAKTMIDEALKADPSLDLALIFRGRYHLQTGETDKALDDLLAGTVANPGYSQGQLLLAAGQYRKGNRVVAEQALDNAERLDRNDPVIAAVRTAVAIDQYDADSAIRNAREYLRLSRARGGNYSSIAANQQAGSTLNAAFRLQGMNAWGEYYSAAAFDPFAAAAYIDQSLHGSVNPFANSYVYGSDPITNTQNAQAFSSTLQGLLLDPTLISSPSRGVNIFPRPFFEVALEAGITTAGGGTGHIYEGEVQGYANLPFPISYYGSLQWQTTPDNRESAGSLSGLNTEARIVGGNAFLAASPTPDDRVVAYYNDAKSSFTGSVSNPTTLFDLFGLPDFTPLALLREQQIDTRSANGGIGWSHTFGHKNVLNTALLYSGLRSSDSSYLELDLLGVPLPIWRQTSDFRQQTYIAAINHSVAVDNLTWRYGVEGGWIDSSQSTGFTNLLPPLLGGGPSLSASSSDRTTVGRAYIDLLHEFSPNLKAEYALFGSYLDDDTNSIARLDPRAGLTWSPAEGQWLRAGAMRSSFDLTTPTLSPVGIVGLQPNQISVAPGGYTDTYLLRWDSEWTSRLFTAVEYQHQDLNDPRIGAPLASIPFGTAEGRIERTSLNANLLLGNAFGLSSTVAYSNSRDEDPSSPTFGQPLPYIPEWAGQAALTWVSPANIRATLAANYIGRRNDSAGNRLDDYWTVDASLLWEPFDKHFELELAAYNLLDEQFQLTSGTQGWGRSFKGTLKVRF